MKLKAKEIIAKYPDVYGKPPFDPMKTLICFGFECAGGWYPVLEKLSEDIQKHLDSKPELKENFAVVQVKEKFGMLSYYYHDGDKTISDLVNKAQIEASKTCERCGVPGKLVVISGWYQTLCEDCKKGNTLWGS